MNNFLLKAFFLVVALFLIYTYARSIYSLVSKSYFIDETKLYKLDTFHLYNRAHITSDGAGRNDRREMQIQFQSINGYSFAIRGNIFKAIANKQQLKDALLCDDNNFVANTTLSKDIKFIPYTTESYFQKYKSTSYPIYIEVYQMQIGNIKYIDIGEANELNRSSLERQIRMPAFIAVVVTLIVSIKPLRKKISKHFQEK